MKLVSHPYPCFILLLALVLTACNNGKEAQPPKTMSKPQDVHSYAQPEEALVTHLKWEASIDFDAQVISGTAHLSIEAAPNAKVLMLDTKKLTINQVTLDNSKEAITFTLGAEEAHMGQALTIPITPETKTVHIEYQTDKAAEALLWIQPKEGEGLESAFLFTQSQAILARSWVPIQDSPGIRFTYEATVQVPAGLMALMSASNPQAKNESGQYTFSMKQPIPAYLLALAAGNLEFRSLGPRSGVYAVPDLIEKAAYEFEEVEEMITVAEGLYGPYRWDRYDLLVLPASFPFGGMENPRLTFTTPTIIAGDRSLTSLVAHELAHSWSGNLVTNANWNDFWLNEGFTVYFEQRIMEALYGRPYAEMLASLAAQGLHEEVAAFTAEGKADETKLKLDLKGKNPDDGVTTIAYDKGYFFLRSLEAHVGRDAFDAFLKTYFTSNAFTSMTTEGFIEYMKQHLFEANNLEADATLWEPWIYQPGLPENMPTVQSDRFALVDEAIKAFAGGAKPGELTTKSWTTHEWLHFLNNLPEALTAQQMGSLDGAFGFTNSGNCEVLCAWFVHVIKHEYQPSYAALEQFLVNVGRRKFLTPLYSEMVKTEDGAAMARQIYAKARPNYHFVSTSTIDGIVN